MSDEHERCWAKALGGCAGGMTREHLVARNQFESSTVRVRGLPWCAHETKEIGLDRMVAKVLCKRHNNDLSAADSAAKEALRGRQSLAAHLTEPSRRSRRVVEVSGDAFERWMLKTTITLALQSKPFPTGGIFDAGGSGPTARMVDVVFSRRPFAAHEGLFFSASVGDRLDSDEIGTIGFETVLSRPDGALVASYMRFHGHDVWLVTSGGPRIPHGGESRRFAAKISAER